MPAISVTSARHPYRYRANRYRTKHTLGFFFLRQIQMYIGDLVSRVVEKLAKYPAGTDCSEDAVGHMLDEEVGGGVAELSACK